MDKVQAVGEALANVAKAAAETVAHAVTPSDPPLPLPDDRAQLMVLHRKARQRRDAAPLMSDARTEAAYEIERIEIHIARIERAMDPPLV